MNVLRVILLLVCVFFVGNTELVQDTRVKVLMRDRRRYQRVRCTRRFTPGSCMDPVRPVWTFVVPLQTCTERLGCPGGVFTNRFNSHEECKNMCLDLVYLFMYLQSLDNETFRIPDAGQETSTRQANVDEMYSEFMKESQADFTDSDSDIVEEVEENKKTASNEYEDFRRSFHDALSNLPDINEDYEAERQYEAGESGDDRPPPLSRRDFTRFDEFVAPDIDHFH